MYDPYIYGKKTHRILTCDIYLKGEEKSINASTLSDFITQS